MFSVIVKKNIDNSFPKMSEAERNSIVEKLYENSVVRKLEEAARVLRKELE